MTKKKINKFELFNVIQESEHSPSARLVCYTLVSYCIKDNTCYPSIRTITRACGFGSENTTQKSIKELVDSGIIRISKRHINKSSFFTNFYEFTVSLSDTANDTVNDTANDTANDTSLSDTEDIEYKETKENIYIKENFIKEKNKKSVLIEDGTFCLDQTMAEYKDLVGNKSDDFCLRLWKWIMEHFEGKTLTIDFIRNLIVKFAENQNGS